jgi:hypothetical protein
MRKGAAHWRALNLSSARWWQRPRLGGVRVRPTRPVTGQLRLRKMTAGGFYVSARSYADISLRVKTGISRHPAVRLHFCEDPEACALRSARLSQLFNLLAEEVVA